MIDIVERLRNSTHPLRHEIADEIGRHMREKVALAGLVAKERDEVERLRAALKAIVDDNRNCADHCRTQARRALEPKP